MIDPRLDYRRFLLPLLLLLAAAAALPLDLPIAGAFRRWNQIATVHDYLRFVDIFELYGHGIGVLLLLFALYQLDPGRRWAIPRLMACAFAGGGVADLVKLMVVRIRPYDFGFDGPVGTTFGQWVPLLDAGCGGQSFPSAHTATAAGLAAGMIWLYPQGRLLFVLLVALVGCQRVVSNAHYPSDVLAGAAVGCLVSLFFLRVGRLPQWFNRKEERWRSKANCR